MLAFFSLLPLASIAFGNPIPEPGNSLEARGPKNCGNQAHMPDEDQYNLGIKTFCQTYWGWSEANQNPIYPFFNGKSLTGTVNILAYDNKLPLRWVFDLYETAGPDLIIPTNIPYDLCVSTFTKLLSDNPIGDNWCYADNTQTKLFKGGKTTVKIAAADMVFDSRIHRGDSRDS